MTLALTVQELLGRIVPPLRLMVPEPAFAVKVPVLQEPVAPLGVATNTLAGRVSVNATPVNGTGFADGFVMVKLRTDTPLGAISDGLKLFEIEGGTSTRRVADAWLPVVAMKVPVPSSKVAVTLPETLFLKPEVVPVTFTENEQELDGGNTTPSSAMLELPGFAVTMPPSSRQVPPTLLGLATTRPLGKLSVMLAFTRVVEEFGLVMVKVSEVVPLIGINAAPKAFAAVGGVTTGVAFTVNVAVLLGAPAPLSLAEIGPVWLLNVPVTRGLIATEMKHDPLWCLSQEWQLLCHRSYC